MTKMWRTLGIVLSLSVAACTGCSDDSGGNDNGNGNGGNTGSESGTCTGTFGGAGTGKVTSCHLEAFQTSDGQVQYSLIFEPDSGSNVESNEPVVFFKEGNPKTGTYALTALTQVLGRVTLKSGAEYFLQHGASSEEGGKVSVTIDKVPSAQSLPGNGSQYANFSGSADIEYAPQEGATGTVTLKLTFKG